MNQLDTLAQKAIAMLRGGEDGDPTYVKCRELYMVLKCQPALIKTVENPKDVARALNIFLSFGAIDDIDILQQISSISYYLISKALGDNPYDINLYKDRLQNIVCNKEAFGYTVGEVLDAESNNSLMMNFMMGLSFFNKRDALIKMEMYDFSNGGRELIHFDKFFTNEFIRIMELIRGGTLGVDADIDSIISDGCELHKKVFKFLEKKLIEDEDLDF